MLGLDAVANGDQLGWSFSRAPHAMLPKVAIGIAPTASCSLQTESESPSACDVAGIVTGALPAIVNITVVKVITSNGEDSGQALDADSKAVASNRTPGPASTEPAGPHFETFVRSGTIMNSVGIIITNKQVIQDAAVIKVMFSNRTEVPAQLIAAASLIDPGGSQGKRSRTPADTRV
jgi:S1-C subfamily serine protease